MKKLLVLLAVLAVAGCAGTFDRDASRVLAVSNQVYDTTMSVLGDLYAQGELSAEVKAEAIELGGRYMDAHNLAVDALLDYIEIGTDESRDKYLAYAEFAAKQLTALIEFAKPYLED
jgi:hypothetical protein